MAVKEWTPEQLENAYRYGVCRACGWPREPHTERDEQGRLVSVGITCPNGHAED